MHLRLIGIVAVAVALALGGCGKEQADKKSEATSKDMAPPEPVAKPAPNDQTPGRPAPASDPAMAKARQIFASQCSLCHGPEGRGNGPASAQMNPKPRDYSNKEWQKTVTDEHIAQVIIKGGGAMGLNPMMPANPTLASQPEVVEALVKLIRSFAQ